MNDFIMDLYRLVEHCNYGMLHDELIHNRIVVGLHRAALSEKLQTDADVTLKTAVRMACKKETIKQQLALLWTDFRESKSETQDKIEKLESGLRGEKEAVQPQKEARQRCVSSVT